MMIDMKLFDNQSNGMDEICHCYYIDGMKRFPAICEKRLLRCVDALLAMTDSSMNDSSKKSLTQSPKTSQGQVFPIISNSTSIFWVTFANFSSIRNLEKLSEKREKIYCCAI